jgi:hexosaminidase
MMSFDDLTNEYLILSTAEILDFPEFRHRGLLVDTSRNFVTVEAIKNIIDGMGLSKVRNDTN